MSWWPFGRDPAPAPEPERESNTERRVRKTMELGEKMVQPWKKALDVRDGIIERLKKQRDSYKGRLDEYVEALKGRDEIIRSLTEEKDDLKAKLHAIEDGERPTEAPEVVEYEVPDSPPPPPVPGEAVEGLLGGEPPATS